MIGHQNHDIHAPSDDVFDAVGTAFDDVHLGDNATDVIARGLTLRRRRRAMPALATAGVLAASLSLALVTQPSGGSGSEGAAAKQLSAHGVAVNIDNAAFSVHTDARTGYITVTIKQFTDPGEFQAVMAKAGIHADVVIEDFNPIGSRAHLLPSCQFPPGVKQLPDSGFNIIQHSVQGNDNAFELNPAAMPPGSVLGVGYYKTSKTAQASIIVTAVFTGNPGTCLFEYPTKAAGSY